jgi:hypothetical protein
MESGMDSGVETVMSAAADAVLWDGADIGCSITNGAGIGVGCSAALSALLQSAVSPNAVLSLLDESAYHNRSKFSTDPSPGTGSLGCHGSRTLLCGQSIAHYLYWPAMVAFRGVLTRGSNIQRSGVQ